MSWIDSFDPGAARRPQYNTASNSRSDAGPSRLPSVPSGRPAAVTHRPADRLSSSSNTYYAPTIARPRPPRPPQRPRAAPPAAIQRSEDAQPNENQTRAKPWEIDAPPSIGMSKVRQEQIRAEQQQQQRQQQQRQKEQSQAADSRKALNLQVQREYERIAILRKQHNREQEARWAELKQQHIVQKVPKKERARLNRLFLDGRAQRMQELNKQWQGELESRFPFLKKQGKSPSQPSRAPQTSLAPGPTQRFPPPQQSARPIQQSQRLLPPSQSPRPQQVVPSLVLPIAQQQQLSQTASRLVSQPQFSTTQIEGLLQTLRPLQQQTSQSSRPQTQQQQSQQQQRGQSKRSPEQAHTDTPVKRPRIVSGSAPREAASHPQAPTRPSAPLPATSASAVLSRPAVPPRHVNANSSTEKSQALPGHSKAGTPSVASAGQTGSPSKSTSAKNLTQAVPAEISTRSTAAPQSSSTPGQIAVAAPVQPPALKDKISPRLSANDAFDSGHISLCDASQAPGPRTQERRLICAAEVTRPPPSRPVEKSRDRLQAPPARVQVAAADKDGADDLPLARLQSSAAAVPQNAPAIQSCQSDETQRPQVKREEAISLPVPAQDTDSDEDVPLLQLVRSRPTSSSASRATALGQQPSASASSTTSPAWTTSLFTASVNGVAYPAVPNRLSANFSVRYMAPLVSTMPSSSSSETSARDSSSKSAYDTAVTVAEHGRVGVFSEEAGQFRFGVPAGDGSGKQSFKIRPSKFLQYNAAPESDAKEESPKRIEKVESVRRLTSKICGIASSTRRLLGIGKAEDYPCQVSLVTVDGTTRRPKVYHLDEKPHVQGAISISPFPKTDPESPTSIDFATGGVDGIVNHWRWGPRTPPTVSRLHTLHDAKPVVALEYLSSKHNVLASASLGSVVGFDLGAMTLGFSWNTSDRIVHLQRTPNSDLMLGVVARRDFDQFRMYDVSGKAGPISRPVISFGWLNQADGRLPLGRGAFHPTRRPIFAHGAEDGHIRIWDLRNARDPLLEHRLGDEPIVQILWASQNSVASGSSPVSHDTLHVATTKTVRSLSLELLKTPV
ncbi:hypothetical protein BCV70DRAFT_52118 [Testicularia cyperi]|uniref:WD40 repeat-like protein n=1 Tax=Testicularia cyperi TaxID=1882483 RepID=A0A317XVE2_9BASI|nr:hypothetical protein BCV70DRAFT_52118 [Testicularia cyperi]